MFYYLRYYNLTFNLICYLTLTFDFMVFEILNRCYLFSYLFILLTQYNAFWNTLVGKYLPKYVHASAFVGCEHYAHIYAFI